MPEEKHREIMKAIRRALRDERGFNLIELMIVIAIIALLIAVGGIGWSAMIRSGNETAAAQTLDRLKVYQAQYAAGNKGKFATFDDLVAKGLLDEGFKGETPTVNGYVYKLTIEQPSGSKPAFFSVTADPQVAEGVRATGSIHYYTDSALSTIKRTDENRSAKADDPSL
ncbi:MAG: prepilin-type N-terminal cleavage/methylation domain-containing protein [Acidobacteria bacterium ACB1]|nr:prepilin-type N-terminal cleavage/methylation domain-containing protein [Acidobacteria bacterium ACB1]RIJ95428.1 MAG: hypothetical protein DCC44_02255 [Acidobacteriota bacterium]